MKAKWKLACAALLLFFAAGTCGGGLRAEAAIVEPSGDKQGKQDWRQIQAALEADGEVRLQSGKTYYITKSILLESNQKVYAKGATIVCHQRAFRNEHPTKTNYNSIKNVTVDGGNWKCMNNDQQGGSMIQFSHSQKITMKNLEVSCNYQGHAIELIAVKDVTIDNCKVKAVGSCPSNCHEEQIQIDVATRATAPKVAEAGSQFVQGQTCQNITVKNCTVTGARGICANFTKTENGKYADKFHKNIVIKNNKIEGKTGEALALFNVIGADVQGNQIVSKNRSTGESYSVGLHISMFGRAPSAMNSAVFTVKNNTIKGGRQGMLVWSHSSSKFGKLVMQKNKCYAKAGKDAAYLVDHVKKSKISGNTKNSW